MHSVVYYSVDEFIRAFAQHLFIPYRAKIRIYRLRVQPIYAGQQANTACLFFFRKFRQTETIFFPFAADCHQPEAVFRSLEAKFHHSEAILRHLEAISDPRRLLLTSGTNLLSCPANLLIGELFNLIGKKQRRKTVVRVSLEVKP